MARSQRSCVFIVYWLQAAVTDVRNLVALRFCGRDKCACHRRLFSPLRQEGLRFADKQGPILLQRVKQDTFASFTLLALRTDNAGLVHICLRRRDRETETKSPKGRSRDVYVMLRRRVIYSF